MAQRRHMCLRCRGTGHTLVQCKSDRWLPEYVWMFEDRRRRMTFPPECDEDSICHRCQGLDLVGLLNSCPPWTTQGQLTTAFNDGHELIRSLGSTGTIEFFEDCSVCRCLFGLTPNPSSSDQEVLMVPDWTICRIAGETGIALDTEAKRHYGTCLVVALKPSSLEEFIDFPVRAHRADALCIVEEDLAEPRTLGGRRISKSELDIPVIQQWLSICTTNHGVECQPLFAPSLEKIHLVDVERRQIIRHPGKACEYIALSYCWGDIKQTAYRVGDQLGRLPQTLEDSMVLTLKLGQRYLWVDSLCIDQDDSSHKEDQIDRMRDIYQGAYVTIVAISGQSGDAGLPRVNGTKAYQQLACRIGPKTLVGLMPTLSQQVWVSPWGQRGWTFQESRLSPRCLIISDHQLYFECKGFQCVESLDPMQSWLHNLSLQSNPTSEGFSSWVMQHSGSGCFRHSVDVRKRRLASFVYALNLYSARKVRYASDRVKAFKGMLQSLDGIYPAGFIEGLPIEDLNWGLLWTARDPSPRQPQFPSWSWAGWEGAVWFGSPVDDEKTCRCPIDLEVHAMQNGSPRRLFCTSTESLDNDAGASIIIRNDPVDNAPIRPAKEPKQVLESIPISDHSRALLITGTVFKFRLDFTRPRHRQASSGAPGFFGYPLRNINCVLRIMSTDKEITQSQDIEKNLLLLGRDHFDKYIIHYFLLVYVKANGLVAERGTALDLFIPMDRLDVLEDLKPKKGQIVLV